MTRFPNIAAGLTLALSLAAHGAFAGDMTAKVEEMNAAWDEAFNAGDAEKVASLYAEDARVITGDGQVVEGRDEIRKLFQGFIDSGFGEHEIKLGSVEGTDDLLYETGDWSGMGGDGKPYGGKLVVIYEKQDGGDWQTVLHMWN